MDTEFVRRLSDFILQISSDRKLTKQTKRTTKRLHIFFTLNPPKAQKVGIVKTSHFIDE